MSDLKETLDIGHLCPKKLIVGNEYLSVYCRAIGIFIGKKRGNNYFIATHMSKSNFTYLVYKDSGNWRYRSFDNLNIHEHFLPIYQKLYRTIPNLKSLSIISAPTNSHIIPVQSDQFTTTDLIKPVYSDKLNKVLINIINSSKKTSSDYKIAKHLISKIPDEICEVNSTGFILHSSNDKDVHIFTLNRSKAIKIVNKLQKLDNLPYSERAIFTKETVFNNLEQTKIGRLVKRFTGSLFTDTQIESFVSLFNAKTLDLGCYKTEVVSGKDIGKWYNKTSYTRDYHGPLHNSCMAHSNLGHQWRFYENHPNVKMVILTMGGSLHARALVWTLNTGEKYLDRIYYTTETEKKMVLGWADEQNIKLRYDNAISRADTNIDEHKQTLLVETNLLTFDQEACFPYFDTFNGITMNGKYLIRTRSNIDDLRTTITPNDLIRIKYHSYGVSRGTGSVGDLLHYLRSQRKSKGYEDRTGFIEEGECVAYEPVFRYNLIVPEKDCTFSEKERRMVFTNVTKPTTKGVVIEESSDVEFVEIP